MRAKLALVRAAPLALLVALGTLLLLTSSLQRLLPAVLSPGWYAVGLALAFLPALLARGSPLPAALSVLVPVLVAASYGASRLDWLRTLRDFRVMEEGVHFARLGLGLLALLAAWSLHVVDTAWRLRERSGSRGILPGQGRAAFRASLRRGALHAGLALAGATLLGALTLGAATVGPALLPVERMAFFAPLAAALLVVAAALLLVGVRKKPGSTDER